MLKGVKFLSIIETANFSISVFIACSTTTEFFELSIKSFLSYNATVQLFKTFSLLYDKSSNLLYVCGITLISSKSSIKYQVKDCDGGIFVCGSAIFLNAT